MNWDLTDGHLTISGEITHTSNSYTDWPWYSQRRTIKSVSFSNAYFANVSNNNAYGMFYDCVYITSLDFSSFDTSNVTSMCRMFGYCEKITSLDLSNFNTSNVTDMSYMFIECGIMTSLNLSNFNTSNVTNMRDMFYSCDSLTSLNLSNFNTSNVTDMSYMFRFCYSLTSLNLSNFNTSNVTDMSYMFSDCEEITSLNLSSFDTSNVTNMSYMFYECYKLTSLDLSNFDTSNVTNMSYMFYYCFKLTSLDLSSFDTSNVTNMSYMFYDCYVLTSLDVSNFNTSSVTNMSYMFEGCRLLTSLNLSNFNTSNVTDMRSMFCGCFALTSLDLSSFDTSNVNDMRYMFDDCSSLISLNLSSFDTSKVNDMRLMFCRCSALMYIRISNLWTTNKVTSATSTSMFSQCTHLLNYNSSYTDKTKAYAGSDGYLSNDVCACYNGNNYDLQFIGCYTGQYTNGQQIGVITYYTGFENSIYTSRSQVPWSGGNVTKIVDTVDFYVDIMPISTAYWFDNKYIAEIHNLYLLNTSNVTNMRDMFYSCDRLTSLDLSNFDTSNVTDMGGMFHGCSGLTSLDLSNFDTSNVTDMGSIFHNCRSLTSLDLSNFNTSSVTNMSYIFYNCSALTLLDLSNFNTSSVTNMTCMFSYCNLLTELDLSNFNTSSATDMRYMFANCYALTSLDLSNFNTSSVTNMSYMFSDCKLLTELDLSNFNTSSVTNMSYMFYDCNKMTSLDLSNFNTSSVTNMSYMFYNCNLLTLLDLSNFNTSNVTDMSCMFYRCSAYIPVFYVYGIPTSYTNFAQLSSGSIYIVRHSSVSSDSSIQAFWKSIDQNYSAVYFEYEHVTRPTAQIEIERGKIINNNWTADENEGTVLKLTFNIQIYNNNISNALPPNEMTNIDITITNSNYVKNTDYTVDSINNSVAYLTLLTNPGNQYTGNLIVTDKKESTNISFIIPGIFAMVEFKKGGYGMSIGKVCTRNGLDIGIPTTIGTDLLLPTNNNTIDLTKNQLVVGQYNEQVDNALFIIGNGTSSLRSNILEVTNSSINTGGDINIPSTASYKINNVSVGSSYYGTCSTTAATAAKVVTCSGFTLIKGNIITVRFTNGISMKTSTTLNVNSTGAKSIERKWAGISSTNALYCKADSQLTFMYQGSYWELIAVDDQEHPIGSCYTTTTNTNPSTYFGGTWELINKEFISQEWYDNTGANISGVWTWNSTYTQNASSGDSKRNIAIVRNANDIYIRIGWYNKTAPSDSVTATIGTLDLSGIGLSNCYAQYIPGISDGLNAILIAHSEIENGILSIGTIDWITRATSIPSTTGSYCNIQFQLMTGGFSSYLDAACDKFIWKRTA